MQPTVGFILLTHTKPHQIVRLVTRLNQMFDNPPIVCHHDFSKCALPLSSFPQNVSFVLPHLQTGWAQFSVVEATVQAIEQMYESRSAPDWFVLLSGSDYPIKSSPQILQDLSNGSYDAHIHIELIRFDAYERDWQEVCFDRYCTIKLSLPSITKRLRPTRRVLSLKHPFLTHPFLPFSRDLRCFAGSQWFCANRRSAEYITDFHRSRPGLAAHYGSVMFAEESYFQTILANAPALRLNNNNWRYTDWSAGDAHPKTLVSEDLPGIISSSAHFARKFDIDADVQVLDELDALVP